MKKLNMEMPIILKIKKRMHKDIAYAQDIIIEELYKIFNNAVIHGGTAIWRCYKGNRFSEDIDIYISRDEKKIDIFFENLEKRGFKIIKKRIKENSLYSNLKINETEVRFEAIFKKIKGFLKEYENADGVLSNIFTLTPEQLIKEKIGAYFVRRKIRDLYDIYFLLRYVKDKEDIKKEILKLTKNFVLPLDEGNLKAIILIPPIPTSKEILEYIKKWEK